MAAGRTQNPWPNGLSSDPRAERPRRVDAAPFRAHVAHLMAAAGLSIEAVALLAGVHTKAVARLIAGQDTGRPRRGGSSPSLHVACCRCTAVTFGRCGAASSAHKRSPGAPGCCGVLAGRRSAWRQLSASIARRLPDCWRAVRRRALRWSLCELPRPC